MARIREDVWTLTKDEGEWPAVLVAYEKAVGLLRDLDPASGPPSNELGWRFLAAMHGLARPDGEPDTSNKLWSKCQHGSWYFLPWHRMYLRAFELIVQHALGDDEWSLPYWYALDPDDSSTAVLPPAFRDRDQELYTDRRSVRANAGQSLHGVIPGLDLSQSVVDALHADRFSSADGLTSFGSGERSTPSWMGGEVGLLEGTPHGAVHGLVGNDFDSAGSVVRRGWMGSFFTAGLDPIFWLHHANIDRLWQVWLDMDSAHTNPTGDPAWMDTTFSFPAVEGDPHTWRIGDVLDSETLGYEYASTAPPSAVAVPVGGGLELGLGEVALPEPLPPQVIGATNDVPLATAEPIVVDLAEPADVGLALEGASGDGRVYLRLENVTGTAAAPVYDVYLNVPAGDEPTDHPELHAGTFSTFGLVEASQTNELQDGSGLTTVLEVTAVRDALEREGRWDAGRVQVRFSPVTPAGDLPAELAGEVAEPADLHAGQIAVVVT